MGRVTRLDSTRDLALIQLPPGVYPWANLASGADFFLGAPVFAIGYPINLPGPATITQGIVSRLLAESSSRGEIIQTDADINLGNSGGPLVDSQGRLMGIITTVLGEYQAKPIRGIGFAVSIKTIREELLPPPQAKSAS
jgi:S1-C subfamily serine protease